MKLGAPSPICSALLRDIVMLLQIMKTAAESLTPVTLELGGKDAFIVCEDVDVPHVYAQILFCNFLLMKTCYLDAIVCSKSLFDIGCPNCCEGFSSVKWTELCGGREILCSQRHLFFICCSNSQNCEICFGCKYVASCVTDISLRLQGTSNLYSCLADNVSSGPN